MILTTWRVLRRMLFRLGINISIQTKDEDVLKIIQTLKPYDCGVKLIRLGGNGDGGYLVPDDLAGIEYCFSPGVDTKSQFENDLANLNITSFLADYSVDAPSLDRKEFIFDKKYLGAIDSGEYFTLGTWKNKYLKDYSRDLILQMDIEGHEYEVILSTPEELLNQFRIVVIEFHNVERLFDPAVFKIYSACFKKLTRYFHVVHIHPNNREECLRKGNIEIPRLMEFTFLNKKRCTAIESQRVFPHALDKDNVTGTPIELPRCWYSD